MRNLRRNPLTTSLWWPGTLSKAKVVKWLTVTIRFVSSVFARWVRTKRSWRLCTFRRDWTFGEGWFWVQLCIETLCKRATSVAHLTYFSLEFLMQFSHKMPPTFSHGAKKSKLTKNSSQGGPALICEGRKAMKDWKLTRRFSTRKFNASHSKIMDSVMKRKTIVVTRRPSGNTNCARVYGDNSFRVVCNCWSKYSPSDAMEGLFGLSDQS